jgi:hypothetical protein
MATDIIDDYKNRARLATAEVEKYKKLSDHYSLLRLGVFALFILAVIVTVYINSLISLAASALVLAGCFSWIVNRQNKFDDLRVYFQDIVTVCRNEMGTMLFKGNIYPDGSAFADDLHIYSSDLDIFGQRSLFQLINRAATDSGNKKLAEWLKAPTTKDTIIRRQEAIKEIGSKNDWKIHIQANLVFALKQPREQIKNLFTYLAAPVELKNQRLFELYSNAAPFVLLAGIIISIFYTPARYVTSVIALYNLRLVSSWSKTVKMTDLIAGKVGNALGSFVFVFKSIEQENWQSEYLSGLANELKPKGQAVSETIHQLSKLISKLNYRLNIVVGILLNMFLLWDIRQVIAIEKWKLANRQNLEQAFDVLAEFEAILSLASLHINYPEWRFPQIAEEDSYTVIAKNLAHPLISVDIRVANDYELDHGFSIDIITGSNMAGKSTFLRTIGINTVLALSGAPACASSMQVSVMEIITYMRIKDSLSESTSTFKAEIDRLKMLLTEVAGDKKVFFLVDEMLRGTNSVDKYRGSKAVIIQLMNSKGVGMVATHDLQIAELEKDYPDYIRNFYFDIQVKDGEMLFDYKIKHGECKTFNASLLLKQIGIDVDSNTN